MIKLNCYIYACVYIKVAKLLLMQDQHSSTPKLLFITLWLFV